MANQKIDSIHGGGRRHAPDFPVLTGRHVALRPVHPADYTELQLAETTGEAGIRWRYRGATPSPEQWAHGLWRSVLAQYLVVRLPDEKPIGLVMAYQPEFHDGHAQLAALKFDSQDASPHLMLGLALFLEYVFACWDLRKLYMEVAEFNFGQFASGEESFFEVEGRLKEHIFFGGTHWDQFILSVRRDRWNELAPRLLAAAKAE